MTQVVKAALIVIGFVASFVVRADDAEIFIRINQLGYRPQDAKVAMVVSKNPLPDKFLVVNDETDVTFVAGKVVDTNEKWGQFSHHAEVDFSTVHKPGKYHLRVGPVKSVAFLVSEQAYRDVPDTLLEFMREQRCGYNPWLDTVCHQFDGRTAYGPMTNGTYLDCRGGWHDAGDLLKYLLTSGNATAQLLLAYQLDAESHAEAGKKAGKSVKPRGFDIFSDKVNALGQTGTNALVDILDEAHWGLEWLLKLHPAPDQLYHQVADDRDHYDWRLPQDEKADYGWGKGSYRVVYFADGQPQGLEKYKSESTGVANLAGRYAAAMGLAYQIWRDDPQYAGFALQCLQAGMEVYKMGKAKEGVQQGNSVKAPYRYAETTWADDMEWGAAELYRATEDKIYLEDAKRYAKLAANDTWMGKEQTGHYQYYPFMNLGHYRLYEFVDKDFQNLLRGYYGQGIRNCMKMAEKNPYRAGVPFIWCSNNLMTALATQCLLFERLQSDPQVHHFGALQRDWLMGRNPWGTSMFTGIPENGVYPHNPHLMTTKITGRSVRGGLVDGPVYERIFKSLKGVSVTEPDPFAEFQDELAVYHDDLHDYSTNEPTMDGTASAILLWVLCNN